jgi:hypothetical protein
MPHAPGAHEEKAEITYFRNEVLGLPNSISKRGVTAYNTIAPCRVGKLCPWPLATRQNPAQLSHAAPVPAWRRRAGANPNTRFCAGASSLDHCASCADKTVLTKLRGDSVGGRSRGALRAAAGALGLDRGRARARPLGLLDGDEL